MTGLITILTFISVILLSFQIARALLVSRNSISRIRKYVDFDDLRDDRRKRLKRDPKDTLGFISKGVGNVRFLAGRKRKIQEKLTRAHLLLKAEEFMTLGLILFITSGTSILLLKGAGAWPCRIDGGGCRMVLAVDFFEYED